MKRKSYLIIALSLILAFSASSERSIFAQQGAVKPAAPYETQSAITPVMSYQGRLVEGGAPVTGTRSMTFTLYNASSAGTAVWSEVQSVTVTNGLFQVALGSVIPFSEAALMQMSQNLWLEINVAGTILPRQQLMGAPYALSLTPGANVVGSTAQTLAVGNTGSGTGAWGHSGSGHGMIASGSGSGLTGSALLAEAYGSGGIAAWALNDSTDASLVVSNDGAGPLVKGFGGDSGEHEFVIDNNGTFYQDLEASGLVKAAVYALCADGSSTIVRSFNNVGGTISITYSDKGACLIDFGFPITERYFSVTAPATSYTPAFSYAVCVIEESLYGPNAMGCIRLYHDGTANDGYFMIVVY